MKRVEEYIEKYTKNCSNVLNAEYVEDVVYHPWLTPDHARRVAEIAREETIKEVCERLLTNMVQYMEYCHNGTGESVEEFIEDLKKHFEGKK